jgi:hypothetical protein
MIAATAQSANQKVVDVALFEFWLATTQTPHPNPDPNHTPNFNPNPTPNHNTKGGELKLGVEICDGVEVRIGDDGSGGVTAERNALAKKFAMREAATSAATKLPLVRCSPFTMNSTKYANNLLL